MIRRVVNPRSYPIERHIAARLGQRRAELGLAAKDIDRAIGALPGAVVRFERLARRVGVGHLYRLSRALGVEVGYFFEGLPRESSPNMVQLADPAVVAEAERLVRSYYLLADDEQRRTLFELVKSLGPPDGG